MLKLPNKEDLAAWIGFLTAHSTVVRALERELQAEQGLPLTWYDVLVCLSGVPDKRLPHQALGDGVLLSRSSITRLVDQMIAQQFLGAVVYLGRTDESSDAAVGSPVNSLSPASLSAALLHPR